MSGRKVRSVKRYVSECITPALVAVEVDRLMELVDSRGRGRRGRGGRNGKKRPTRRKGKLSVIARGSRELRRRAERQILVTYHDTGAGEEESGHQKGDDEDGVIDDDDADDKEEEEDEEEEEEDEEDAGLETSILIHLPPAFPLDPLRVESSRGMATAAVSGGSSSSSLSSASSSGGERGINLQMTAVLAEAGSLRDAVEVWRGTAASAFAGVEPCPICYLVIHPVSKEVPRKRCRTCRKKFHPQCLVSWFSTSHKSSCPMCRSPF